jgi:hypothetical protein
LSSNRYRYLEIALILIILIGLGIAHFSRLTPEQRQEIELEAGLEQLYQLELEYFRHYERYFDPTDLLAGLDWQWMEEYEWEVRIQPHDFWIAAKADLDRDGEKGAWLINSESLRVHLLVED